jgi:hypothetical protein
MSRNNVAYLAGAVLLIAVGVLLLLWTVGAIQVADSGRLIGIIVGVLFALGGAVFIAVYLSNRPERWWALIPGFALLGVAFLILFGEMISPAELSGAIFMGFLALGFLVIYFTTRANWWAIIPGGVLLSVAAMIGATLVVGGDEERVVAVLFLGMAITFGIVYLLPTHEGRMRWAIFPASVLLIMAVAFSVGTGSIVNYVWAAALIAGGVLLVLRAARR